MAAIMAIIFSTGLVLAYKIYKHARLAKVFM